MHQKKAKLRLNPLQLRTLALLQELAEDPDHGAEGENGARVVTALPHAHGDHMHIGRFTVPARFASGLSNESVIGALCRRGFLTRDEAGFLVLLPEGLAAETGVREQLFALSDH